MSKTARAQKTLEGLCQLYLLISYQGFSRDEAGNDIPGVVTIPEGGFGCDLTIREPQVHAVYQQLKRGVDRVDERNARAVLSLAGKFYRILCDIADGGGR